MENNFYCALGFVSVLLWKYVYCQQYIGDMCTLQSTGEAGQCQLIQECPTAIHTFHSYGIYPQNCGFRGRSPIVCCAGNTVYAHPSSRHRHSTAYTTLNFNEENGDAGRKSRQKCQEYGQLSFAPPSASVLTDLQYTEECPFPSVELVVRNIAKPREFPHMAAIGYDDEENRKVWKCSGSLISESFVLTAGKCLSQPPYGKPKYIRLGDLVLNNDTDNAKPQEFEIIERISHPNYRPPSQYHDIALLKMDRAADFSSYVKPACLNVNPTLTTTLAIVTGWANNESDLDTSRDLYMAKIKYAAYTECNNAYTSEKGLEERGIVEALQICAGAQAECQENDVGGPLQIYNNLEVSCTYKIVGVTSFPKLCGSVNMPGVYTRVSKYIKWIEDHVWP